MLPSAIARQTLHIRLNLHQSRNSRRDPPSHSQSGMLKGTFNPSPHVLRLQSLTMVKTSSTSRLETGSRTFPGYDI